MNNFRKNVTPYVEREVLKSKEAEKLKRYQESFKYLENAHVLGQESTCWHLKVHYLMFVWAIRRKDIKEVFGQLIRIIGAAALTSIKGVPTGNTGGSNVSPFKPMPIKPEHAKIIAKVKWNA